jgi:hypothetical protein
MNYTKILSQHLFHTRYSDTEQKSWTSVDQKFMKTRNIILWYYMHNSSPEDQKENMRPFIYSELCAMYLQNPQRLKELHNVALKFGFSESAHSRAIWCVLDIFEQLHTDFAAEGYFKMKKNRAENSRSCNDSLVCGANSRPPLPTQTESAAT